MERYRRARVPSRALLHVVLFLAPLLSLFVSVKPAHAFAWMIRHDYTACATCHADPSGAGILTRYGRAQSEVLLRTRYGAVPEDEDPSTLGGFAFGAVPLPEWLELQADVRGLALHVVPPSPAPSVTRTILMQADAAAALAVGRFRASGSLGYAHEGALGVSVTHGAEDRIVSRQHWVGFVFGPEDTLFARAGRMNLPYGLRIIEHTSFVRAATKTDINAAQSHGASLALNTEHWRAEAMVVAGNFQLAPMTLHERGATAYVELAPSPSFAIGISSLVLHAEHDLRSRTSAFRQAHGVFARYTPAKPVVLFAEGDLLAYSPKRQVITTGTAGLAGVDVEPITGLHVGATGEVITETVTRDAATFRVGASSAWFFAPHADVRIDASITTVSGAEVTMLGAQAHFFL